MTMQAAPNTTVQGEFVTLNNERFYKIGNVDHMNPFFISVVSASDHWLFISSTGSLSAGRIRPENALFPYKSVDYIHESADNTGAKSIFKVRQQSGVSMWEPFNPHHDGLYEVERNLYKNAIGDKIVFEETNHSLGLRFQYSWSSSEQFGFVRRSELTNLTQATVEVEMLDGIQNLLPPGAPLGALQTRSALVDAYKWNEKVEDSSLALYTMYAKLSDRADPAESLLATTVFSIDSDASQVLLSSQQVTAFRKERAITAETLTKGVRGSYLIHKTVALGAGSSNSWSIVADIDKSHKDVAQLRDTLKVPVDTARLVEQSIAENQTELVNLMSGADAWQCTAQENTTVHHYANVLFNNMRGGVIENNYQIDKADVVKTLTAYNQQVMQNQTEFVSNLESELTHAELIAAAKKTGDQQLVRLCYEYLPLTFGRRHGDPSRPWNHYEIKLKDENGDRLLSYQGNWRDIFQNWEAMALSYPGFIGSFIAKFVNASTADGYNPYRITKQGIDWEILDPTDPWSNIGYWGDHQIIYLLKFLELADKFDREALINMLTEDQFSYAHVPYEICGVDGLFANPKDTVSFNQQKQDFIDEKVAQLGSDGRLMLNSDDTVYQVNLLEKVLVPLLSKLSNLVVDGGIWLNTQRPEWNDANNAIVGNGLSMVTLYYMRRYVAFMQQIVAALPSNAQLSAEVVQWINTTTTILNETSQAISEGEMDGERRMLVLKQLAGAAELYRVNVYEAGFSGKQSIDTQTVSELLTVSLEILDSSIRNNLREDGLYNAYNILTYTDNALNIEELYPMLEGQVSVLSSGLLTPEQSIELIETLFTSEMYRADQDSFMLYPDRDLSSFLAKNQIPAVTLEQSKLLSSMLEKGDRRLIEADLNGALHFNAQFENVGYLRDAIAKVKGDYVDAAEQDWQQVEGIFEEVFNHKAFTGRSGTMFGYEGLGCIYWHMVSKLLLATQENYLLAVEQDAPSEVVAGLAKYYYRVRDGIGFNKSAENYGAFPTDPYSHTPKQAGAQQPGMTGQVKEEILTRFVELGLFVDGGQVSISPTLLNRDELLQEKAVYQFQNVQGETCDIELAAGQLGYSYCQVPFVYTAAQNSAITVVLANGESLSMPDMTLTKEVSSSIFNRDGKVLRVEVSIA